MGVVDVRSVAECLAGARRTLLKLLVDFETMDILTFEHFIIILGQYLYCKYYKLGTMCSDHEYSITPYILEHSIKSKWRFYISRILQARNLACHQHGTDECVYAISFLYKDKKTFKSFLSYIELI